MHLLGSTFFFYFTIRITITALNTIIVINYYGITIILAGIDLLLLLHDERGVGLAHNNNNNVNISTIIMIITIIIIIIIIIVVIARVRVRVIVIVILRVRVRVIVIVIVVLAPGDRHLRHPDALWLRGIAEAWPAGC